jgi:diguanylate cyclase (GGDEF)-like protein
MGGEGRRSSGHARDIPPIPLRPGGRTRPAGRPCARPTAEWLGVAVAGAATAAFALTLPGGPHLPDIVRNLWLYNLAYVGAIGSAAARAVRIRKQRTAWAALALGLAASMAGNMYYSLVLADLDSPPYPSLSDLGLLLLYPLVYVTLVSLLRARMQHWHPSLWLDGLIVAFGVGAFEAAFVLGPVLELADARFAVAATNLAYPLGDLLLMSTVVVGMWMLGRRVDLAWSLLGAGVLAITVGDSIYLVRDSAGLYVEGTALDLTWQLGCVLLAGAAAAATRAESGRASGPAGRADLVGSGEASAATRWALLAVPTVASLSCVGLMVPWGGWQCPALAQWLAAGALCVVVARTMLTYREVWELADVRRESRTDDLTGLTNRRGFTARAESLLSTDHAAADPAAADHAPVDHPGPDTETETDNETDNETDTSAGCSALLLLDLDRFKEVNDSLGHQAGDQLLVAIAQRLTETCRGPHDLMARLGGDEFAILLPGTDQPGAEHVARRIGTALSAPFLLDGVRVQASVSIGIALAPLHGRTLSLLMRRADIAMYRAKATHTGHAVYDASLRDPHGEDRLQRLQELRTAIDERQLTLHYQPKIDLATGAVTGVEALVRWNHPTRGVVYPDAFLQLAEDAGLMPTVTALVLDRALDQAAAWLRDGRHLTVAVNLPSAAVVDTFLPERIADLLEQHRVPASCLKIEITEESLLEDRVRARDVLARLRGAGVHIAIDDYGSGYSSLAYLRELPVDELKLDRSFILPMADDARAAAIVRSTVELAHSLGLRIVAEGVEHAASASELTRYGCDSAQGYLYTRALPPAELVRWLDHRCRTEPFIDAAPIPAPRVESTPIPAPHVEVTPTS